MPSLKAIKKRIVSVKNTQKITRAMKLVAAAKLRRSTERAQASRPFEKNLVNMVSAVLRDVEWNSPLTEKRAVNKTALVVISSDRGLCGSLNTNVFKLVNKRVSELGVSKVEIIALGKKARAFARRRGVEIRSEYADIIRVGNHEWAAKVAQQLRTLFLEGHFDRIEVFYPRFQSALAQVPTLHQWLPFEATAGAATTNFIYEPDPTKILDGLVPMLLDFQFYRMILEAIASEHGARMSAMESATKNASEMIGRLTLARNRARQAAITTELMEIIGGAEALKG